MILTMGPDKAAVMLSLAVPMSSVATPEKMMMSRATLDRLQVVIGYNVRAGIWNIMGMRRPDMMKLGTHDMDFGPSLIVTYDQDADDELECLVSLVEVAGLTVTYRPDANPNVYAMDGQNRTHGMMNEHN